MSSSALQNNYILEFNLSASQVVNTFQAALNPSWCSPRSSSWGRGMFPLWSAASWQAAITCPGLQTLRKAALSGMSDVPEELLLLP